MLAGISCSVTQTHGSVANFPSSMTNPQRGGGLSDCTTDQVKQLSIPTTVLHVNKLVLLFNFYMVDLFLSMRHLGLNF